MSVDVVIHTLGWSYDHPVRPEELPSGLLHCIAEINGQIVPGAQAVRLDAEGGDFASAAILVNPTSVRTVACTQEEWDEVSARYDAA